MARKGENIYRRKDGRWEARYIRGCKDGKALYGYVYGKTYSDAKAKKKAAMSAPECVKAPDAKPLVTFDVLASLWLAGIKTSVRESTYTRYFRTVKKYLAPLFGSAPLMRIDGKTLSALPERLTNEGGIRKDRLSAKTVTDILCVLKAILRYGGENGYPVPDTGGLKHPQKSRKVIKIPTDGCRERIVRKLMDSGDLTSLGIIFSLFTGVRIGELCGLRWGDIDFEASVVTVSRTVERIADLNPLSKAKTKLVVSEPKTENSARVIPLPDFLLAYLGARRRGGGCYLITGNEKHTEPHRYYVKYKRCLKEHGIEDYTFHALRHSFATCCVERGFDLKSLSEIMGHSDVATTLSLYVHPTLRQKKEQMERLAPTYLSPSDIPSDVPRNAL